MIAGVFGVLFYLIPFAKLFMISTPNDPYKRIAIYYFCIVFGGAVLFTSIFGWVALGAALSKRR